MRAAPKPIASLSSGLLARKGQARPAMRRQPTPMELEVEAGDDLGWNDMGEPLAPAELPPVLVEREELAASLDAVAEPIASAPPIGRRAAFTLRLDAERHLRLRLASATRAMSAQKLVTEALDAFLKTMPEGEALAGSVAGATTDRTGT